MLFSGGLGLSRTVQCFANFVGFFLNLLENVNILCNPCREGRMTAFMTKSTVKGGKVWPWEETPGCSLECEKRRKGCYGKECAYSETMSGEKVKLMPQAARNARCLVDGRRESLRNTGICGLEKLGLYPHLRKGFLVCYFMLSWRRGKRCPKFLLLP